MRVRVGEKGGGGADNDGQEIAGHEIARHILFCT